MIEENYVHEKAGQIQNMLAFIQFTIFWLPTSFLKVKIQVYKLKTYFFFFLGVKLGVSPKEKLKLRGV
jgi:hypothetical protein